MPLDRGLGTRARRRPRQSLLPDQLAGGRARPSDNRLRHRPCRALVSPFSGGLPSRFWFCLAASALLLVRLNLAGRLPRDNRTALADLVLLTPLLACSSRSGELRSRRAALSLARDARFRESTPAGAGRFRAENSLRRAGSSSWARGMVVSSPNSSAIHPAAAIDCVEASARMIALARARVIGRATCDFIQGDIRDLGLRPGPIRFARDVTSFSIASRGICARRVAIAELAHAATADAAMVDRRFFLARAGWLASLASPRFHRLRCTSSFASSAGIEARCLVDYRPTLLDPGFPPGRRIFARPDEMIRSNFGNGSIRLRTPAQECLQPNELRGVSRSRATSQPTTRAPAPMAPGRRSLRRSSSAPHQRGHALSEGPANRGAETSLICDDFSRAVNLQADVGRRGLWVGLLSPGDHSAARSSP